jgi:signal transduction histidine kinase
MFYTNITLILLAALIIVILSSMLLTKMQNIRQMQADIEKLTQSLEVMDEQARIIVRADLELNRIQEELDKKITGLYALQKLSHSISSTRIEEEIFKNLNPILFKELGFERVVVFNWNIAKKEFALKANLGYLEKETQSIVSYINSNKDRILSLVATDKTTSSVSSINNFATQEDLRNIFKSEYFIFSPILPKNENRGFIFTGTTNTDIVITDGDEELIKILATQLSQALENTLLFEKTWNTQLELEKKVKERTLELTKALEEVKKISRRKTDFVSSVSHELRTPLTSIKGYTAILLTGKLGDIPPEAKERLEKMNRHSDELGNIVNDLLDISRIESGKISMNLESHDLRDIVNKVADLLSGQLKEKGINLEIKINLKEFKVLVDYIQINRVFVNLIGNAMKFTPAKGKISVYANSQNGVVQVNVSDTGCGIPEGSLETIFEEFFRVENSINQEVKGTGLGLALVKHIIEAHQGKIWVQSKVGSGSTFSFTLQQAN